MKHCLFKADFESLNESQKDAVKSVVGRVRLSAGAGTGKTKTLAMRYAYLVNVIGINPLNIVCITFTNKAAREMRARICRYVDASFVNDFICTIHGLAVKILKRDIIRLGYPENFVIIDTDDQKHLIKEVMRENDISIDKTTLYDSLDAIKRTKALTSYIEDYIRQDSFIPAEKDIFEGYLKKQKESYALDFYDLINFAIYLLTAYADVRDYWQNMIQFMMIDEAQDCNVGEWSLINILTDKNKNLFFVGDPDQAIYEWRGAQPDIFVEYIPDIDLKLEDNYRSSQLILDAANSLIEKNEVRIKKELHAVKDIQSSTISFYRGEPLEGEAEWVLKQIKLLLEEGAKLSDIAILYRANSCSREIEEELIKEKFNYELWGGVRFFERKEIKDVLAYLRLVDSGDNIAFTRVFNVPSRKLGDVFLHKIKQFAEQDGTTYVKALLTHSNEFRTKWSLATDLAELIRDFTEKSKTYNIERLTKYILQKSGYRTYLRKEGDAERIDNVKELLLSMKHFVVTHTDSPNDATTYLQEVALFTNIDKDQGRDTIKLMTIHQAKGLEFPYVFIVSASEGIIPNYHALRERGKSALEEERRLFFVAITRAMKQVFISDYAGRNYDGAERYPSRFLGDIGREKLIESGCKDEIVWKYIEAMRSNETNHILIPDLKIKVGSYVICDNVGIGKVLACKDEKDGFLSVFFKDAEQICLRLRTQVRLTECDVTVDEAIVKIAEDSKKLFNCWQKELILEEYKRITQSPPCLKEKENEDILRSEEFNPAPKKSIFNRLRKLLTPDSKN